MPSRSKQAYDHEVYHSESKSISLTFSGGQLKGREHQTDEGYGVRVLKDGKLGFGYCESGKDLKKALSNALFISRFSPETKFSFSEKQRYGKVRNFDRKVAGMSSKELKDVLDQVRDGAEKYSNLSRVSVSTEEERFSLENTLGLKGKYARTELGGYTEVMDGNGSGFAQFSSNFMVRDPTEVGARAAEMAKGMRHPEKMKPGKYTVITSLETLNSFLDILLPSFSGDWERRNISKLCSRKGEKLFAKSFTLEDNGMFEGLAARPFDDEGIPSKKRVLVKAGHFSRFVYDMETAALAKKKASGHCNRSHYSMPPVAGISNLIVGTGDYTDLEEELNNYLLVHSAHGSHTANVTTGDFGLEVSVAFYKKGKKTIPVRGFMLVGNVFDMFRSIKGIEKKRQSYGSLIAPRMAFKGLRVV